jgi:putative methyltransferase (TIGR04325 family)
LKDHTVLGKKPKVNRQDIKKKVIIKLLDSATKVKKKLYRFERDGKNFERAFYDWKFLYFFLINTLSYKKVNILDFGGGFASSYYLYKNFLKGIHFKWNIIEQNKIYNLGKKHFQNKNLIFYKNLSDYLTNNNPDLIILSGVLQYLENPYDALVDFAKLKKKTIIIDRTSFSSKSNDQIYIQHVPKSINQASYPIRIFSEKKFFKFIKINFKKANSKNKINEIAIDDNKININTKIIIIKTY